MLSSVESNLKLVKLLAQHGSTFSLFRSHPCVAQQSGVHLHSNAQHVEPRHAQCPAYSKIPGHDESTWAFEKSSDCSINSAQSCDAIQVFVEVIWTPRSTTPQQTLNMLTACTVDKSSAFPRGFKGRRQYANECKGIVKEENVVSKELNKDQIFTVTR